MNLERSINYAQMVLDNSTDAIVLMGLDYSVLAFNQNLVNTIQAYSGKILKIGDDYRNFVTANDKEVFFDLFQRAIAEESVTIERLASLNDISIWFEYKMNPTYDKEKIFWEFVFVRRISMLGRKWKSHFWKANKNSET